MDEDLMLSIGKKTHPDGGSGTYVIYHKKTSVVEAMESALEFVGLCYSELCMESHMDFDTFWSDAGRISKHAADSHLAGEVKTGQAPYVADQ